MMMLFNWIPAFAGMGQSDSEVRGEEALKVINVGHPLKMRKNHFLTGFRLGGRNDILMRKLPVLLAQGYLIRVSKGAKPLGRPQG
jgi:hypothetical protein